MILTLIIIALAFGWLLYETDFLRVRLESTEYQKSKALQSKSEGVQPESNSNLPTKDIPYYWKSAEQKEQHLMICHNNWHCPYKSQCGKTKRWTAWKLPAKSIKAFGHTLNLNEQCNILRAMFLKTLVREHKRKPSITQPPLFKYEYIYQSRIGSHHEYAKWNHETQEYDYSIKPKKGYIHRVVEDYTTKYRDCLCGKDWLKAHEHDQYPEPMIDISIDSKTISVNGNYKQSLIKEFMGEYTYKARAGKKTITAMKGQRIVNCGGGVYVAE